MFSSQNRELVANLQGQITGLQDQIEKLWDMVETAHGRYDELLEVHNKVVEQFRVELDRRENLRKQLETASQPVPMSSYPLYMSETEEDARYQLENGLIDRQLYEDILAETNLLNTEVTFESP